MNLIELLSSAAGCWPEKPALIEGDEKVTYRALVGTVEDWALRLEALGIAPGSRIGLRYPNSAAYVGLTFALWKVGAIVVPIPPDCTDLEVAGICSSMQLEGVISQDPEGERIAASREIFLSMRRPPERPDNRGLNIAFIRFTSGTTSARKGVLLCHETVRDRVLAANKVLGIGPEDTILWCLPMSHHFLVTVLLYLAHGATVVLARHVLAGSFIKAVNRWGGTVLYAAPFHYSLLAQDASGAGIPTVRLAVSTTCGLPRETADAFRERFGLPVAQALGVIELGLVSVNLDDPVNRWNSVGRPLPEFAVKIREPDADGCGEILVRGPGMFDAYLNPWTWRNELMPDGWFATGDMGRLDRDGYLYIVGRRAAVINLAGRKVFPEEIEAVLNRHPAVRESRVYGAAHSRLGEIIEAEVALRFEADAEALRSFCRGRVSPEKIPSRFHFVEAVARTGAGGKIRRAATVPAA